MLFLNIARCEPEPVCLAGIRMALSVQVYLQIDRPDQAEKQLKVYPLERTGSSCLAGAPSFVAQCAARSCAVAVHMDTGLTSRQPGLGLECRAALFPPLAQERPALGRQGRAGFTLAEARASRAQAMSALDDDATLTQLATAWVDLFLVRPLHAPPDMPPPRLPELRP